MDQSPKKRDIEALKGDASEISQRGKQITTLGDQMMKGAELLKKLHDGAMGQKGLAVDKLEGKVTDCHEELHKAGERYQPTGPVLTAYGSALGKVQPLIASDVTNCEHLWHQYELKRDAAGDLEGASKKYQDDPPDEPAKPGEKTPVDAYNDANHEAQVAYNAWHAEATDFDKHYDTWEEAFDTAAKGVGKANHGNISDGFWDDLDGFVAGMLKVLTWVGIALTILAIVIGGPILAALVAIVAVATLALTIYQKARGDAGWGAVILAAIGVIPVGKLGVLFKSGKFLGRGGKLMEFARESPLNVVKNVKTIYTEGKGIVTAASIGRAYGGKGLAGLWTGARTGVQRMNDEGSVTGLNAALRAMTGMSSQGMSKITDFGGAWELMYKQWGQAFKIMKYTQMATGDK